MTGLSDCFRLMIKTAKLQLMHHHLPLIKKRFDNDILHWLEIKVPFFLEHFDVSVMHGKELIIRFSPA